MTTVIDVCVWVAFTVSGALMMLSAVAGFTFKAYGLALAAIAGATFMTVLGFCCLDMLALVVG
jgi:hypothetical protein